MIIPPKPVRAELVEAPYSSSRAILEETATPFRWLDKPAAQDRLRQAQGERSTGGAA